MNQEQFAVQAAKPEAKGPETLPWFWHPNRVGVRFAPPSFMGRLQEFDKELSATWDPIKERWLIWMRSPQFAHKICWGWKLLFVHWDENHEYLPLDERIFARLYEASADKWGNGRKYWEHLEAERARDAAKREAAQQQEMIDMSMPFYDYSQIKISMRGKSNGSKFADYLS